MLFVGPTVADVRLHQILGRCSGEYSQHSADHGFSRSCLACSAQSLRASRMISSWITAMGLMVSVYPLLGNSITELSHRHQEDFGGTALNGRIVDHRPFQPVGIVVLGAGEVTLSSRWVC